MNIPVVEAIDAVLEISGLKDKVARDERVVRLKQRFNLDDPEALSKFENVYAYAVDEEERLALPKQVVNSNAAELAHQLGEWFGALGYDRKEYEEWTSEYFEWIINFQIARRRSSRTLVRGVADEVDMADLQDFLQAVERVRADEGWLVEDCTEFCVSDLESEKLRRRSPNGPRRARHR